MGKKYVKCAYCGDKVLEKEATYVEGRPYCYECYTEAEAMAAVNDGYDEDEDEEYDDDYYDDE
jgi:hypothetical protein